MVGDFVDLTLEFEVMDLVNGDSTIDSNKYAVALGSALLFISVFVILFFVK